MGHLDNIWCFRLCDRMSLRCLGPWIYYLPLDVGSFCKRIYSKLIIRAFDRTTLHIYVYCQLLIYIYIYVYIYWHLNILVCWRLIYISTFGEYLNLNCVLCTSTQYRRNTYSYTPRALPSLLHDKFGFSFISGVLNSAGSSKLASYGTSIEYNCNLCWHQKW